MATLAIAFVCGFILGAFAYHKAEALLMKYFMKLQGGIIK